MRLGADERIGRRVAERRSVPFSVGRTAHEVYSVIDASNFGPVLWSAFCLAAPSRRFIIRQAIADKNNSSAPVARATLTAFTQFLPHSTSLNNGHRDDEFRLCTNTGSVHYRLIGRPLGASVRFAFNFGFITRVSITLRRVILIAACCVRKEQVKSAHFSSSLG